MKTAYAFLGVIFVLIVAGAFFLGQVVGSTEEIPSKYTCDGENTSIPLYIGNVPNDAKSLVLIMDDPDIPQEVKMSMGIDTFDHWILYNIPPQTTVVDEGVIVGTLGLNTSGEARYTGPCPPPQYKPKEHRYIFKLYALSDTINFTDVPTKEDILKAISNIIITETELIGRYVRQ